MNAVELLSADFSTKRRFLSEASEDAERWYNIRNIFNPTFSEFRNDEGFSEIVVIIASIEENKEYEATHVSPIDDEEVMWAKQRRYQDENFSDAEGGKHTNSWGFVNPVLKRSRDINS